MLAGDAVGFESVLHANSLLTGNFTGKIAILGLLGADFVARNCCAAATSWAIPYAKVTGKIFRRTGIFQTETGKIPTESRTRHFLFNVRSFLVIPIGRRNTLRLKRKRSSLF